MDTIPSRCEAKQLQVAFGSILVFVAVASRLGSDSDGRAFSQMVLQVVGARPKKAIRPATLSRSQAQMRAGDGANSSGRPTLGEGGLSEGTSS